MKKQELRQGNYAYINGEFFQGLTALTIHRISIGNLKAEPIILNEVWLNELGFTTQDYKKFTHPKFNIKIIKGNGFYMSGILNEIKYVHQLQNIYYCITNQELTIK